MKKWIRIILLMLLVAFVFFTGYAYSRHQYEVEVISVGKYIEMTDFDMYITEIWAYGEEKYSDHYFSPVVESIYNSGMPDWFKRKAVWVVVFLQCSGPSIRG